MEEEIETELREQIDFLTKKCERLERENRIYRRHSDMKTPLIDRQAETDYIPGFEE
jgi:hypothetical protein